MHPIRGGELARWPACISFLAEFLRHCSTPAVDASSGHYLVNRTAQSLHTHATRQRTPHWRPKGWLGGGRGEGAACAQCSNTRTNKQALQPKAELGGEEVCLQGKGRGKGLGTARPDSCTACAAGCRAAAAAGVPGLLLGALLRCPAPSGSLPGSPQRCCSRLHSRQGRQASRAGSTRKTTAGQQSAPGAAGGTTQHGAGQQQAE